MIIVQLFLRLTMLLMLSHVISAQDWWPRIYDEFWGRLNPPLRRCRRKTSNLPITGNQCKTLKPKTCFFGSQNCSSVGVHPEARCTCSVTNSMEPNITRWTCADETCPPSTLPPLPPFEDDAKPVIYKSIQKPGKLDVTMKLLTPAVLNGYNNTEELGEDLNHSTRFYVNAFIEAQANGGLGLPDPIGTARPPPEASKISTTATAAQEEGAQTNFYQTNNLEEGVDEADEIKSDGTYVYASYGNVVVIWDAITGQAITNYTLPPLIPPGGGGVGGGVGSGNGGFVLSQSPINLLTTQILGMSLEAQFLVLYVKGYGSTIRKAAATKSAFTNAYDTRIIVLDTSTLPASIDVVTQSDIHGSFQDAHAIGTDIHVVTVCSLDYANTFASPLYRYNPEFVGMNSSEYVAAATAMAIPRIDTFVTALKNDVMQMGGMPNIPKISIWQTDLGNNTNIVESIYTNGAIQTFTQLTSFSVADLINSLSLSTAGAFTPSVWGAYTYTVDGSVVLADEGYNWNPSFGGSAETTFFLGFKLNGASAEPSFVGSVPGYLNNKFHLNSYNGTMTVATTVDSWWPVWVEEQDESGNMTLPSPIATTNNSVYVFRLPTATSRLSEVGRVENLGQEGERISAVRFFRNVCYAVTSVTFPQTEPFHMISTDPNDVRLLGDLPITGFWSYIYPISDDDSLWLAVGREFDMGSIVDVQISLLDGSDPINPIVLHRYTLDSKPDGWTSSTVRGDYKAFRYLPLGLDSGILIIPLKVVEALSEDNVDEIFDGFVAYDVSREDGISQRLNVTYVQSQDACFNLASLPDRSFVFNGTLTTMKGHSVVSTDLESGETRWTRNIKPPQGCAEF